jgi:hypothetical protein
MLLKLLAGFGVGIVYIDFPNSSWRGQQKWRIQVKDGVAFPLPPRKKWVKVPNDANSTHWGL